MFVVGKAVVRAYRVLDDSWTKLPLDLVANAVSEGVDTILLTTGTNTTKHIKGPDHLFFFNQNNFNSQLQLLFIPSIQQRIILLDPGQAMGISAVEMFMKLNASGIIVRTTSGYGIVARRLRL
ncbi:uncharacterized protein LOC135171443 [Diachasmimorpha longicaudata]|uniref:uncharacterized protein LOC135171443 n=1 Tax=Diachasmimorpha longicaudata TaxID=58733 RepID=UPI0030B902DC